MSDRAARARDRRHVRPRRRAFTITELLIVIAIIAVLMALLLPALGGVWRSAEMTKSMSNLKQIQLWMTLYSSDNRETILPSQFDYSNDPYEGKVRQQLSDTALGSAHAGTWTDILWTLYADDKNKLVADGPPVLNYRYDSPDKAFYDAVGGWDGNTFRAGGQNTQDVIGGTGPKPFGTGAQEAGEPGYFAANNFFDATGQGDAVEEWYATGQIRYPGRSMYLVDSFAGEIIEDEEPPFDDTANPPTIEVDFRYGDLCLMLFLDGHIDPEGPWTDLANLQNDRKVRVQNLTQVGP
jgi:prepilin-type N-terminal cleavage/methylation domain-containing protein